VVRGEATEHSDLDVVVVHRHLPEGAYRESFHYRGWPVEAFVHDPLTLEDFYALNRSEGVPSLVTMVVAGIPFPAPSDFSAQVQHRAAEAFLDGPAPWSAREIERARYAITDLCDDLRSPRTPAEAWASAALLHGRLAEFYFRARGLWSAKGKAIPRRLTQVDPALASRFDSREPSEMVGLAESILEPFGGLLFDGFRSGADEVAAPVCWTAQLPDVATPRLRLRLAGQDDCSAVVAYFRDNRVRLAATDPPRSEEFYTEAYWKIYLGQIRQECLQDQSLRLFMFLRSGQVVGTLGFSQMHRGPFQACYLGYSVDGDHEGQGLMSEALRAALGYVFDTLNYHRVMANYLPDNVRSARLLEKIGFVVEGRAAQYLMIDGQWRDHVLTSLTNPAWRPLS
jgi:ribosomal-protein-alanine N-acetyltransferase